jgi:hypothetical protein
VQYSRATGWVGWVLLGSILLIILGVLHVGTGLVALVRPEVLAATRTDLLLPVGPTVLACLHIVVGAAALTAAPALLRGSRWARVASILLACMTAVVNFVFVDVYPAWSVTSLALTTLIIYAVAAHGAEMVDAYGGS